MSLPDVEQREVEATLSEAENRARKQGALTWELRIARAVARVRASQGKNKEARETLEHVYSRYSEGFDTHDLKAAAQAIRSM